MIRDLHRALRDRGSEAEERSNNLKHGFNPSNEVEIKVGLEFLALLEMLKRGRKRYEEVHAGKARRGAAARAGFETCGWKKSKAARLRITESW